jgi:hypothetical protein
LDNEQFSLLRREIFGIGAELQVHRDILVVLFERAPDSLRQTMLASLRAKARRAEELATRGRPDPGGEEEADYLISLAARGLIDALQRRGPFAT